jgi:polyphosphate glucokinase
MRTHTAPGDIPTVPEATTISQLTTLAIDFGGLSVKASILDARGSILAEQLNKPTPYPFSPGRCLELIEEISNSFSNFDRITIGFPGMIRHGVVIYTPHYVNQMGPHTKQDPTLLSAWSHFDLASEVAKKLNKPTLALNDAQVHGAGVITGKGIELVLTLGTGLGYALFDSGELAPHIELSHFTIRKGKTFDTWIGEAQRRLLGDARWSKRISLMIDELKPVFRWDYLYLGGGNARRIKSEILEKLGDRVSIVPNLAGITGGVRAWELKQIGK